MLLMADVHVTGKHKRRQPKVNAGPCKETHATGPRSVECHLLPQRSRVPRLLAVPRLYPPILILPTSQRALQLALQLILVFLPRSTLHGVRPLRAQRLHQPAKMPQRYYLLLSNERQKRKSGCVVASLHCHSLCSGTRSCSSNCRTRTRLSQH